LARSFAIDDRKQYKEHTTEVRGVTASFWHSFLSVSWRCWLGDKRNIWSVKIWHLQSPEVILTFSGFSQTRIDLWKIGPLHKYRG